MKQLNSADNFTAQPSFMTKQSTKTLYSKETQIVSIQQQISAFERNPQDFSGRNINRSQKLLKERSNSSNSCWDAFQCDLNQNSKLKYESVLFFTLQQKQVQEIAAKTKEICQKQNNLAFFCFLTNYLLLSCINLSNQGLTISAIQELLKMVIQMLKKNHPAGTEVQISLEEMEKSCSFSMKSEKYLEIDISECLLYQRTKGLQIAILNQVKKAAKQQQGFKNLLEHVCLKYGFHFKHGLKIKNQYHHKAINRVLEKMLKKEFRKMDLKQEQFNGSLEDVFFKEHLHREKELNIILNKESLFPWTVKDLLRGKCFFKEVGFLLQCKQEIFEILKQNQYQVICLKNRLRQSTSDLVINFVMNETICQMQLAMDFPSFNYEFNHLLYEIERSKFLSTLSSLKDLNEELTKSFLASQQENIQIITPKIKVINNLELQALFQKYNKTFNPTVRMKE